MTSKRYLLLEAEGDVTPQEWKDFALSLERRFGRLRLIPVEGNERALVVKTDDRVASRIREEIPEMRAGGSRMSSVLTSGAIGKLKRRAREDAALGLGKVPQ